MDKKVSKAGKYMSLLLRHAPEKENLIMDKNGYVLTKQLIKALDITMQDLEDIVSENNKQRFSFSSDRIKIRANQGHSVDVDVELTETKPPQTLYHGTATKFLESIYEKGIVKGQRKYVHLSKDEETATDVGSRHGTPFILEIDAEQMYNDGISFFISVNVVWLTDFIDSKYIKNGK